MSDNWYFSSKFKYYQVLLSICNTIQQKFYTIVRTLTVVHCIYAVFNVKWHLTFSSSKNNCHLNDSIESRDKCISLFALLGKNGVILVAGQYVCSICNLMRRVEVFIAAIKYEWNRNF